MTLKTRLEKLDNYLTPKQYTLTLIDEMRKYRSFEEYSYHHVIGRWGSLRNDFDKVTDGIRAKMKGEDKKKIAQAVSKAAKEGAFLYLLLGRVMLNYEGEHYRHAYNSMVCIHLWQSAANKSLRQLAKDEHNPVELKQEWDNIKELIETFKHRAHQHLHHLLAERRVTEEISRRYFDGRELMFDCDRENLENFTKRALMLISNAQDIADEMEYLDNPDGFGEDGPPPLVDVEAIRAEVERDLEELIQYEIDMTRADVFSQYDKIDKGWAIYEEYGKKLAAGGALRR